MSNPLQLHRATADFNLRNRSPRSAAPAVVLHDGEGQYMVHSKSSDISHVEDAEDAVLFGAVLALEKLIREANRRFAKRVHVKKAKLYLHHKNFLSNLKQTRFAHGDEHTIMAPAVKEFWKIVYLAGKAGIALWLYWIPKSEQVLPHVIADWAVRNHHHGAEKLPMDACEQLSERYRDLRIIPRIDDLNYPIAGSGDLVTGTPHSWNVTQDRTYPKYASILPKKRTRKTVVESTWLS